MFGSLVVLVGIEKVRIVPAITASNPFDLYYMPYTHSVVAALLWSLAAYVAYRAIRASASGTTLPRRSCSRSRRCSLERRRV